MLFSTSATKFLCGRFCNDRQQMVRLLSTTTERFKSAVETRSLKVRDLPDGVEKLELYALYKQATSGDVKTERPGMMDFINRAKWDAWNECKGKDVEWAMTQYVSKTEHFSSNRCHFFRIFATLSPLPVVAGRQASNPSN